MCLAMARPRPVPPDSRGSGLVDAIEAFEQAREVLGRNASAEILDEKFDGTRNGAGAENDSSARGAVFQGVVDQVGKHLVNSFAVGENWWKTLERRTRHRQTRRRRIRGILYL